jgi:hypothetical protein
MRADFPKPLLVTLCSFRERVPLIPMWDEPVGSRADGFRRSPFARSAHLAPAEFGFPVLVGVGFFIDLAPDIGVRRRCPNPSPSARLAIGRHIREDHRALRNADVAIQTGVPNLDLASSRNLHASKYRDSVIGPGFRGTLAEFWETVWDKPNLSR